MFLDRRKTSQGIMSIHQKGQFQKEADTGNKDKASGKMYTTTT